MTEINTILNLGLDKIPKYGLGSWISRVLNTPLFGLKKLTIDEKEHVKIPSLHTAAEKKDTKETKKASTSSEKKTKKSDSDVTVTPITTEVTTTVALSNPTTTTTGGYMDWMSEYSGNSSKDTDMEPFSSSEVVWEDPALSKIDTGIVSRYLKNNLQGLIDAYHAKLAENVGQKRT